MRFLIKEFQIEENHTNYNRDVTGQQQTLYFKRD
jgi:hypothetical protein